MWALRILYMEVRTGKLLCDFAAEGWMVITKIFCKIGKVFGLNFRLRISKM
jgi:hypothetical protein